jgi:hypothetical protein
MSEFQYYEFVAIDRPLSTIAQKATSKPTRSGQVRASFAEFSAKQTLRFHGQWSNMAPRVMRPTGIREEN